MVFSWCGFPSLTLITRYNVEINPQTNKDASYLRVGGVSAGRQAESAVLQDGHRRQFKIRPLTVDVKGSNREAFQSVYEAWLMLCPSRNEADSGPGARNDPSPIRETISSSL